MAVSPSCNTPTAFLAGAWHRWSWSTCWKHRAVAAATSFSSGWRSGGGGAAASVDNAGDDAAAESEAEACPAAAPLGSGRLQPTGQTHWQTTNGLHLHPPSPADPKNSARPNCACWTKPKAKEHSRGQGQGQGRPPCGPVGPGGPAKAKAGGWRLAA